MNSEKNFEIAATNYKIIKPVKKYSKYLYICKIFQKYDY